MALLAVVVHVVAQRLDIGEGELLVGDFGLLQTDDVRLVLVDQCRQLMRAGAQTIDIERNQLHCGRSWENCDASPWQCPWRPATVLLPILQP
ncbi:hypothetical protein D3C77_472120 [compost metagenome]